MYKAPGSGMARGELRSTLSRAGPCRCQRSRTSRKRLRGYVLTGLLLFVKTILKSSHNRTRGAARKALILSKIAIFGVVIFPTLILVK